MLGFLKALFSSPEPAAKEAPEDLPALGWDALLALLEQAYGASLGSWGHKGVMAMFDLREPPQFPLDGVEVWDGGDFWHFQGFGMSELYSKDSEDLEFSGWGYELCLRLEKTCEAPPVEICDLLQQLCRAQWGRPVFEPGHTLSTGPMAPGHPSVGFALAEDPTLGTAQTPNGKVQFLLLVGLDQGQLDRALGGNALQVLEGMSSWVTPGL